jgi:hypothetical protein
MHDRVDPRERAAHDHRIADVPDQQIDVGIQVHGARAALAMHLRHERIQRAHPRAAREEMIGEMGTDESGPSRDEDPLRGHCGPSGTAPPSSETSSFARFDPSESAPPSPPLHHARGVCRTGPCAARGPSSAAASGPRRVSTASAGSRNKATGSARPESGDLPRCAIAAPSLGHAAARASGARCSKT